VKTLFIEQGSLWKILKNKGGEAMVKIVPFAGVCKDAALVSMAMIN
jgi:hypothetical protein